MSSPKKNNIPADKLDLYDKLVRTNPKVERKGAANLYTSLNGHMFTYLNPSGSLALRLPENEREKFLKKYRTTLFEAYGAVMNEYVTVPDSLLRDTKTLQRYFQLSYEYIKTLKPKPTKKKP
jgi:TfoX/Sxy family transcriptional regulator of competence genes